MKYQGCLLVVKDITVSKDFYENVLHQNILMDIGAHVTFDGFSLQQGYAELIGVSADSVIEKSHNFQIYFEIEDLDEVYTELKQRSDLLWVHEINEYPWGQRDIRIYDPDKHIVEIAEDMGIVIRRFIDQGMTIDEVAVRTMFPVEVVRQYAL